MLETATNPSTGERLAFINNAWVPFSETATNPKTGEKLALINNQWMPLNAPTAPKEQAGFFSSLLEGATTLGKAGEAARFATASTPEEQARTRAELAKEGERATTNFADINSISSAVNWAKQTSGSTAGALAAPAAASLAGLAVAGPIGAAVGGFSTLYSQYAVDAIERQAQEQQRAIQEGRTPEETSVGKAAIAAAGETALDAIGFKFFKPVFKAFPAVGKLFGEAGEKTAKEVEDQIVTAFRNGTYNTTKTGVLVGSVKGAAFEIPQEIAQTMLERWQAGQSLTDKEARAEYLEAGAGAVLLGSPLGGAKTVMSNRQKRAEADAILKARADEAASKSATTAPAATTAPTAPTAPAATNEEREKLIAEYQTEQGMSRKDAELLADQDIADAAAMMQPPAPPVQTTAAPATATAPATAQPDPVRIAELEIELVNAGVEPAIAKRDALAKATQEAIDDAEAATEAMNGQTASVPPLQQPPAGAATVPPVAGANQPSVSVPAQQGQAVPGAGVVEPTSVGGVSAPAVSTGAGTESVPAAVTPQTEADQTQTEAVEAPQTAETPAVKPTRAKPTGRIAKLTPEQLAANKAKRQASAGVSRDMGRTAEKLKKAIQVPFNVENYDTQEQAKDALEEYNAQRIETLATAYNIANNPAHRNNKAGKTAKTVLDDPSVTAQERSIAQKRADYLKNGAPKPSKASRLGASTDNVTNNKYLGFTSATQALQWISRNGNPFERFLANRLAPFLKGVKLVVVDQNTVFPNEEAETYFREGDGSYGMFYDGVIYLDSIDGINNTIFLHEALHGAADARIEAYYYALANKEPIDKSLAEAVAQLEQTMLNAGEDFRLLQKLADRGALDPEQMQNYRMLSQLADLGAFEDLKEFVAYGLTDQNMQAFLRGFSAGELSGKALDQSVLSKFVTGLRKLFNMDSSHQSAMQDLILFTDRVLAAPVAGARAEATPSLAKKTKKVKKDTTLEKISKGENAEDTGGFIGELLRSESPADAMAALKAGFQTLDSKSIKALLPALTTSQITDWVGNRIPNLTDVNRTVERMATMRMKMLNTVHDKVVPWFDFAKKFTNGAKLLSRTMHYTTLAEFDPSMYSNAASAIANDPKLVAMNKELASAPVNKKAAVKGKITRRTNTINNTYKLWDALGKVGKGEGQTIYKSIKNHYSTTFKLHRAILDERINNSAVKGDINDASTPKGRLMAAIRKVYEDAKFVGVYFPLMRYGNFWVGIGKGANREFYMFESELQRNLFLNKRVKQLNKAGDSRTRQEMQQDQDLDYGNDLTKLRNKSIESSRMLQEIFKIIDSNKGVDTEALKDSVYQMYLMTMPEQSFRKQFIHRKGTAGFSGDALRNFVRSGTNSANQLSRLRYGMQVTNQMDAAHESLKGNPEKPKLEVLLNEVGRRVGEEVAPQIDDNWYSNFANGVNQAAFLYYMTSPKSALIQMTAIPVFGYPVLASRYGEFKAAKALASYTKIWNHASITKRDANGNLKFSPLSVGMSKYVQSNPVLAAAFEQAVERGVTEITRTYDLLSAAKNPSAAMDSSLGKTKRTITNFMGAMFHSTERISREIMFMSTFELAYDKAVKAGMSPGVNGDAFTRATDEAVKNTYDSMFNYSRYNRPRAFRSPTGKIALQFKMYPQQVTAYLVRNFYGMLPFIKGNDNKREAATQFFGTLLMTGAFAGITGMPLYGVIVAVLEGMRAAMRGEDDDPIPIEERDLDAWFRYSFLPNTFGNRAAEILTKGPVSDVTNLDIASSTSLNNLWLRDIAPNPSLESQFKDFVMGLLGPGFGMADTAAKAYDDFKNGYVREGMEKLTPAMFRGMLVASRWAEEGQVTKGLRAPVMEPEELTLANRMWRVVGFNPTELSRIQDANFSVTKLTREVETKRQQILNRLNLDLSHDDMEHFEKVIDQAIDFSIANPERMVEVDTILNSVNNRAKLRAMADRGLSVPEALAPRLHAFIESSRPARDR